MNHGVEQVLCNITTVCVNGTTFGFKCINFKWMRSSLSRLYRQGRMASKQPGFKFTGLPHRKCDPTWQVTSRSCEMRVLWTSSMHLLTQPLISVFHRFWFCLLHMSLKLKPLNFCCCTTVALYTQTTQTYIESTTFFECSICPPTISTSRKPVLVGVGSPCYRTTQILWGMLMGIHTLAQTTED